MAGTDEGIGGRKWSFLRDEAFSEQVDSDGHTVDVVGALRLMEGRTPLAALTPDGERVKLLLVTAPQLWQAANAVMVAASNGGPTAVPPAAWQLLGDMVAKAAGKDHWQDVAQ